jgi:hypothetical protein
MSAFKSIYFILIILVCVPQLKAQTIYQPAHEEIMFSFKTSDNKTITLNKDKIKNNLVFRMGNDEAISLQYPPKIENNDMYFTYSFYLRGGGEANEGMELNYIYFILNGIKYVMYDNSHWSQTQNDVGLKMIEMTTQKTSVLTGNAATVKGNLMQFRNAPIVKMGDEIFD